MMRGTNPAVAASTTSQIRQELKQEINALLQQIHVAEEKLSMYEPDPGKMTSMEELEAYGPKFQNGSKRRESNEADLLAYDDAFNQPQSFDSSVNYGTTSERNNMFSTIMVPSNIKGSSSSLNVEKIQAPNDN
ncbi:hypothetical protein FXO38_15843 [Capsicum annuum]|nr:hypothetical protein FXO37_19008 [Capsicum annuum]KAF3652991.1 hypothetical protein FXO38_15843 [Capsicum annuum]